MVQKMDNQKRSSVVTSDENARKISTVSKLTVSSADESSVMEAINNAMSFRKINCESIEELLNACDVSASQNANYEVNLLGVSELEPNAKSRGGSRVPRMPPLRSPGPIYSNNVFDRKSKSFNEFAFFGGGSKPNKRSRPKRRTERTNTTPVLGNAAKNCFLLGALSEKYSVDSVSTSFIKENEDGQGTMFMPIHTVVILGELSVGKSALCRQFFRSGMKTEDTRNRRISAQQMSFIDEDDDYNTPTHGVDDRSDSHHIYERPVDVNGICERIRILDINAEKHGMECEDYADFEPYLKTGNAYIIAYAVTDRGTYKTAEEILSRMSRFHSKNFGTLPVILVGNKCDLVRRRQVSTTEGINLAAKHDVKFIETSASLNQNVTRLFEGVIQQIRLRSLCKDTVTDDLDEESSQYRTDNDNNYRKQSTVTTKSSHSAGSNDSALGDRMTDSQNMFEETDNSSSVVRCRSTEAIVVADDLASSPERPDSGCSSAPQACKRSYKKRASRCLMRILNRRDGRSRKSKSCQDLSVL